MRRFYLFSGMISLFLLLAVSAHAGFSSIYIFGDSTSTTTSNTAPNYYGKRNSNGRCWVEVLAERQGLGANSLTSTNWNFSTNNRSGFGENSAVLVASVNNFNPPAGATNALFAVWVCNADFADDLANLSGGAPGNLVAWTNSMNQHLTNHVRAITNLYAKGMRTLVAPNAVDLLKVPQYSSYANAANRTFIRQRIIDFNNAYSNRLTQVEAANPGLNIVTVDIFSLFEDIVVSASKYGLTNVVDFYTNSISVLENLPPGSWALNGPGTNYVWWGPNSPSARFHEVIADTAQQLLSPVNLASLTPVNTSNQLQLANAPVGMNGIVQFVNDITQTNWQTNSIFNVSNQTQTTFVIPTNSIRFYRVKFPWQWTWP